MKTSECPCEKSENRTDIKGRKILMQYNKERILSRLMEMIQIDSVSYKEGPMTDYLKKYF